MPAKGLRRFHPLDAVGVDYSRPVDQVTWRKLTNVYLDDGWFSQRPALRPVGPVTQDTAARSAGIITAIAEAAAWGQEDTSFGITQVLTPSATVANSNWSITGAATAHEATDESPPDDDSSYISTTTDGAAINFNFTDLSASPEFVDHVIVKIRTVALNPAKQTLSLYYGNGELDGTLIETKEITNTEYEYEAESTNQGYMDYFFHVYKSQDDVAWNPDDVDAAQFELVFGKEARAAVGIAGAATTGQDDDFETSGGDNWAGTNAAGHDEYPLAFFVDDDTVVLGTAGDRVSFQYESIGGFSAVSAVKFRFAVARKPGAQSGSLTVYHVGTDAVRRDLSTGEGVSMVYLPDEPLGSKYAGWDIIEVESTENPETSSAWTNSEVVNQIEAGIEVESGSGDVYVSASEIIVEGTTSSDGIKVTQIQVIPVVRQHTGSSANQEALGRVMATTTSFFRLELQKAEDLSEAFDDILGSATAPAGGLIWDWSFFLGNLYFENAVNDTWHFAGSNANMADLSSGHPIGHTMWSFGQRLWKGDWTQGGTRNPLSIYHSVIADPDDFSGAGSGSINLTHGGTGRVRKGLALSSHLAAVYLDQGIYTLRWTGDDSAPFIPKFVDADTGIVAPRTCQPVLDQGGVATHLFLGRGPEGIAVYSFDGASCSPVSTEIDNELKRLMNDANLDYAFAHVERQNNLYLLFIPEGDQLFPEQCWVYHISTGDWTRWEFPFGMTCAGEWTLVRSASDDSLETDFAEPTYRTGEKYLILGTTLGTPFRLDFNEGSDWTNAPGPSEFRNDYFSSVTHGLNEENAAREAKIDVVMETGSMVFGEQDVVMLASIMRAWVTYEDRGQAFMKFTASQDGNANFAQTSTFQVGSEGYENVKDPDTIRPLYTRVVDISNPTAGRHHALRLENNNAEYTDRQSFKISKLIVEYQVGGEM